MKGIVLAGGTGSRLWPMTQATCKQLLPVYDKPLIYYPIATLMQFGIREILVITTDQDQIFFKKLLGDGNQWGISLDFEIQKQPIGLAHSLILGESFVGKNSVILALGDNVFFSSQLAMNIPDPQEGATIFAYEVSNPSSYGVVEVDSKLCPVSIEEKPPHPKSNLAVTGLYIFDSSASRRAKEVSPSARGELEITSVIDSYLQEGNLRVEVLKKGSAWLDSGTPQSLNDASNFVRILEERTGIKVSCPEEIAYQNGWISISELTSLATQYNGNSYGQYLNKLLIQKGGGLNS
jgi:glucose-1-phosphate thymidylyltransferase